MTVVASSSFGGAGNHGLSGNFSNNSKMHFEGTPRDSSSFIYSFFIILGVIWFG
jgi:hypothetical protein